MSDAPLVSVIIPVWNLWDMTEPCLRSLAEHSAGENMEVVVVDNHSTDATVSELEPLGEALFGAAFTAVRMAENVGFARGCNAGAQAASGDLLFFLNNDTTLTPGWLPPLRAVMADPRIGAAGPLLLYPDGTVQHCGIYVNPFNAVGHLYEHLPGKFAAARKPHPLQAITGAALMLRKAQFDACCGFHEGFRNGFEDIDLCFALRAQGLKLRVESRSRTLFENKFDDAIQLCAMSPNGTLAVFTKSKLYVYDPMFENIYTFQTQDLPTALAFAGDNRQFAAGCPYAEGGALGGTVYLMDTRKDEYVTIRNTEGMPVKIQYLTNAEVLVLYDTYAAVYDTADGTELYRYSYGGRTLQSAAISAGKNAVLLFGDGVHGALTQLTILDATLSEAGSADVNERASGVAASRTGAFVLTNDGVLSYGLDGVFYGATVTEAKPLAMVNGRKLLLLEQGEVSVFEPPAPPSASAG